MYENERHIIPFSIEDFQRLAKRFVYPYIKPKNKEVIFESVDQQSNINVYTYELTMFYSSRVYSSGYRLLRPLRTRHNYRKQLSILEVLDHYILVTPPTEVTALKEYRKTLIEYDKDGLLTKPQKGYVWDGEYWEMMFAPQVLIFTRNFNMFIDILRFPIFHELVGDRLRYYDFNADNPLVHIGLTANVLVDYILNHPYMDCHDFIGLKNPRQTIIEYLKKPNIPIFYFDEEADDIEDTSDNLMIAFLSILTEDDLSKSYGYIESLLCSMYLSEYKQWVSRIRLGDAQFRFTVHHHQVLREVYGNGDYPGVEDIDWSKHPKDNFKNILTDIEMNHRKMMDLVKSEEDRRPIDIPDVTELLTGKEMIRVGNDMNICIGGEYYVNQLSLNFKNFYVIGNGLPKDKIVIEVSNRKMSSEIIQAVTVSNEEVTTSHKYYQTYLLFQEHIGFKPRTGDIYGSYTYPGNIQNDVINQMRLIGLTSTPIWRYNNG